MRARFFYNTKTVERGGEESKEKVKEGRRERGERREERGREERDKISNNELMKFIIKKDTHPKYKNIHVDTLPKT